MSRTVQHQSLAYRIIKGKKYQNYCDLIHGCVEDEKITKEVKILYKSVRRIKHPSGYYQLFVSND